MLRVHMHVCPAFDITQDQQRGRNRNLILYMCVRVCVFFIDCDFQKFLCIKNKIKRIFSDMRIFFVIFREVFLVKVCFSKNVSTKSFLYFYPEI